MAQNADIVTPSTNIEQSKQYPFTVRDKICELLYLDSDTSDVTFLFPKKDYNEPRTKRAKKQIRSIPAHKIFLKAGSKVFFEMFNGSWKEKKEVEIVDATPEAFKEFLQCFYLGSGSFTKENIDQVMYLADKYMIDDCLAACSTFLMDTMTLDDFSSGYTLSILYKQSKLRKFCEAKIDLNAKALFVSADFLDCKRETLAEILKLDLYCDENTVFGACLNWAKNACKKTGLDENNVENLRNQLGDCLYLIRFGSMTLQELCQIISKYDGLLRLDELQDAMQCIGTKGHESKKFIHKPRFSLVWDENNIWCCSPSIAGYHKPLRETESIQFTANKSTLLGGVRGGCLYKNSYVASLNASIDVIEKSSLSDDVLFSGTMHFSNSQRAHVKLPAPIIIKNGFKYEMRLKFNDANGCYIDEFLVGKVKSSNGLQIDFQADGGTLCIDGLDLMDVKPE